MAELRKVINSQMAALIDGCFGCLDAAAETINTRNSGSVGKGTLSKRLSGQLSWPVEDVAALEEAAGRYPVSKLLARRLDGSGGTASSCLYAASGVASKEVGEAVSAALRAAQSADGDDLANAIKEAAEGEAAMRRLREALEGME